MIRFEALIKIYYLLPLDPSPSICARKGLVYIPSLWFKLTRRLAPNPPPALTSRRGAHFVLSSTSFPALKAWASRDSVRHLHRTYCFTNWECQRDSWRHVNIRPIYANLSKLSICLLHCRFVNQNKRVLCHWKLVYSLRSDEPWKLW